MFRGLDFVFVYLDDILVASSSAAEHLAHLQQVFARLQHYGLVVNAAKCLFGQSQIDFLGHLITSRGATPLPLKVRAVHDFARPTTMKGLQQFLGMVNYYHRFISAAATILQPLYTATRGRVQLIRWTALMDAAFQKAKIALSEATMLVHLPCADAPLALTTDASDLAIGAVLEQFVDQSWQPLAFYSRQLWPPERKYSTFDRELLALYLAVRHFHFSLEGHTFALITSKFVWHQVRKDIRTWARSCVPCQTAKIHKHVKAPLAPFAVPNRRFEHIHVDLVGPLPLLQSCSYLFTIVDRFTRWPEAIPLANSSANILCVHSCQPMGHSFWRTFNGLL